MSIRAYYNDNDRQAAAWLRELIADGLIADGDVDERSIVDVSPDNLRGYRQVHLFAGIGGWSYALRLAGIPDDFPVWTGSCPCQPFSAAGKRNGTGDARHLWPEFRRLLTECRPAVVFGEQVSGSLGLEWLAGVRTDLEALGYAVGATDLCAAGVNAPHIRQRLYWGAVRLADTETALRRSERQEHDGRGTAQTRGSGFRLGDAAGQLLSGQRPEPDRVERGRQAAQQRNGSADADDASGSVSACGRMEDALHEGSPSQQDRRKQYQGRYATSVGKPSSVDGLDNTISLGRGEGGNRHNGGNERVIPDTESEDGWSCSQYHLCRDGKYRKIPLESSLFPLAHGLPGRVGLLRGAGNAIVPQCAAAFITAFLESLEQL